MRIFNYESFPENYNVSRAAPGPLAENEYHFGNTNPKVFDAIYLKGDSCDDLKMAVYGEINGNEGFITHGAALGPREKAIREKWYSEEKNYRYSLICVPYVKDVKKYLEKSNLHTSFDAVYTDDGIAFVKKPEDVKPALTRGKAIKKVYPCPDKTDETCVDMGDKEPYRIFCWDCSAYKNATTQSVTDNILFEFFDGSHRALFWSDSYMMNGAIMTRDYDFRREQLRALVALK